MKTRFAPSPTGWMHFGNLRTALFNFLFAHKMSYKFLLRIEDTDLARSTQEFQAGLTEDLKWLHLEYDEGPFLQSERGAIYAKYYKQLEDSNFAYPCFCSEETLNITRKSQQSSGQPPRYPGTCRKLSKEAIAVKFAAGELATLRFEVPRDQIIEFKDLVKGPQRFAANDIGDFIIRRNDGSASFMFCNAIDDAEMQVTHALRGDDHLTNTPRQIMIMKALNKPYPEYGHFAMINGSDGTPLSKRNGSQSIRELRTQGYLPLAVLNYLARLGHYYADNNFLSLEQLVAQFDLKHISTSPARHDLAHLKHWQKEAMMRSTVTEVAQLIQEHTASLIASENISSFAELMKDNILMPEDAKIWVTAVAAQDLELSAEDAAILKQAGKEFFSIAKTAIKNNSQLTFKELADTVKTATNFKGKELFMPLRIALTGQQHGPEMAKLMGFMSHDLLLKRCDAVLQKIFGEN
jgi:nondiscriminating glutamyl-tRNA synthetase